MVFRLSREENWHSFELRQLFHGWSVRKKIDSLQLIEIWLLLGSEVWEFFKLEKAGKEVFFCFAEIKANTALKNYGR